MPRRTAPQSASATAEPGEPSSLDELLTPPAVATLLGVSPPTVYAALRREAGGLEHLRTPGGQIRVRRREVLGYCHRNGIAVPAELLDDPEVFVVHPDRRAGTRLGGQLEGVARPRCFTDAADALVEIGAERPAMVLLSDRVGAPLVERICAVVSGSEWLGYTCLVRLVPGKTIPWRGGPVPVPLEAGESSGRHLASLVGTLLGNA